MLKLRLSGRTEQRLKGKWIIVNENRVNFTAAEQADGAQVIVEGKVKKNEIR